MSAPKRILITGTTSGLGQAFLDHYHQKGCAVVSVNRRAVPELQSRYPEQTFETLDITDRSRVHAFMQSLAERNLIPDVLILNAGINRPDNVDGLDSKVFEEVMAINLNGVLNFVSGLQTLKWTGRTVLGMSSTSNIVPNPGHVSYHISKWAIWRTFQCLAQKDTRNVYKSVILGPVKTNIMAGYPPPTGLQGKLFNWMAVEAPTAVAKIAPFLERKDRSLYYPLWVCAFYQLVQCLLKVFPQAYQGSTQK